ncbi:GNAT family N-acetyltransferase [Streptomyces millisiae]|uniref:GNAT family N-acetyltransferase n=1 Tax=Streptomyces millisiae TaxID=3075542 RepID=A0ABU2LV03_9ACTN|nr:GNAT family N-acetyltransferase [Streptomyces sp. DSM 44918]MDT0321422.1 GNAT family N-acetyltransferase [Streptomyces sp. DSM 44918]
MTSTAPAPRLAPLPYTHPYAQRLLQRLYAEQLDLYGFADDPNDTSADDYVPPNGLFVIASLDHTPVACGGWRRRTSTTAEIKRMYATPEVRGLGLGHCILTHLEHHAATVGMRQMLLETGLRNTAALRLYTRTGYRPTKPYVPGRDPQVNRALHKPLIRLRPTMPLSTFDR